MKLMVCTDGSEHGDKAVKFAVRFAEKFGIDGLTILHLIAQATSHYPPIESKKQEAEAILSRAKKLAEEVSKDISYDARIAPGPVSPEIVRIAEVEGFDLIVMGTRGLGGLKRMLVGSVADDVVRHAHCHVTVVR